MRRYIFLFLLGAFSVTGVWAKNPDLEILVKFKSDMSKEKCLEFLRQCPVKMEKEYTLIPNLFLCSSSTEEKIQTAMEFLNALSEVDYVEHNASVQAIHSKAGDDE